MRDMELDDGQVDLFEQTDELAEILGGDFVETFVSTEHGVFAPFMWVISPREGEVVLVTA